MPTALHDYEMEDASNSVAVAPPTEEELPDSEDESESNDDAVIDEGTEIIVEGGSKLRQPCKADKRAGRGMYYAVRVGYAPGSPLSEDDDDDNDDIPPSKKRKREESMAASSSTPMVKIHSAIFLYWEDVRQFVDTISCCTDHKTVYAAFNSFEEAEEYLLEEERENALNLAIAAEMEIHGAVDKNNKSEEKGVVTVNREPTSSSSHGTTQVQVTVQENPVTRGPVVIGDPYGGSLGMLNPYGSLFGGVFGMGGRGPLSEGFLNYIARATTTGPSVSIPNHTQTRESMNDIGKKNELNIGKSASNEENTAPLKSKGKKSSRRHVQYWGEFIQVYTFYLFTAISYTWS